MWLRAAARLSYTISVRMSPGDLAAILMLITDPDQQGYGWFWSFEDLPQSI